MSVRTSRRRAAFVPLMVAGLVMTACGGSEDGAETRPTVTLAVGETSYATLPPATTIPAEVEGEEEESAASGVQEYTIVAGDYGYKVADQFGVSLEDLEDINGWSSANVEFPGIGSVIKIPPGATVQSDADAGASTDSGDSAGATDSGETAETIPTVGDNCPPGSYVIEAGDTTRFGVAEKFDVTVEAMDAANASLNGYDAFYPGLKIVIPAKDGC